MILISLGEDSIAFYPPSTDVTVTLFGQQISGEIADVVDSVIHVVFDATGVRLDEDEFIPIQHASAANRAATVIRVLADEMMLELGASRAPFVSFGFAGTSIGMN